MSSTSRVILFATASAWANGIPEDAPVFEILKSRGLEPRFAIWDDPAVRWDEARGVVIRSIWDYHRKEAQFRAWLDRLEGEGIDVRNPVPMIRWNMDKHYLRDMADAGAAIPATRWFARGQKPSMAALMAECGWRRAVIKPAVSAGARDTWVVDAAQRRGDDREGGLFLSVEGSEARLHELLERHAMLIQEYLDVIETDGEWSLLWFRGAFSHAIVKRPRPGDFRIQVQHGGIYEAARPTDAMIETARQWSAIAARACNPPCHTVATYERYDFVVHPERGPLLMEAELIEPHLYLSYGSGATERFAMSVAGQ